MTEKLSEIRSIMLQDLAEKKIPGLSKGLGLSFAESACTCLEEHDHKKGVNLSVDGKYRESFAVYWKESDETVKRSWAESEDKIEYGAYGIASLIMPLLTDYTIIRRSIRGTGFDFWLTQHSSFLFQNAARLEVSGIYSGNEQTLQSRVNKKINQTKRSDGTLLPAYIVVVEFSSPRSRVVER